jgi:hypothetical protein
MQNRFMRIKKVQFFLLLSSILWMPLPLLYLDPPRFLQGQPLAVYAIVLFLGGMSSAALGIFLVLKTRRSPAAARLFTALFLLAGIGAYQLSGLAPNWSCFGKQIYAATASAAGQNCTTVCTDNDVKPCSGWSTCWDKFVSCDASGKDQDGRNCEGCCFSCNVVCEPEPDEPPTITSSISCSQAGTNGWCRGTGLLTLTASDPQGYSLTIKGNINGSPFTCAPGNTCFQPLPQGSGTITYTVTAAQSGMSANGSTSWKLDATPPSINGTLSGALGAGGWYLGPVTYNGSASDSLSGLASHTCTLDGAPLGSCNTISVSGEGAHAILVTARDQAGNSQTLDRTVSIDVQNPNLTSAISGTLGSNNWHTSAALNASASDPAPGSGLSALEYSLDGGGWTAFPASGTLALPQGTHGIELRAVDHAGRIATATKSYALDRLLPDVTINPSGTLGTNNWYTTDLILSASASDAVSGMDVFEYSLNDGAWTTYSSPLTLMDGTHDISFWAQDRAGLVRQVDGTYRVDTRPPQIAGSLSGVPGANGWYISQVTIGASAADPAPGSGLEALTYILDSSPQTAYSNPLVLSDGEHSVQFSAQDQAGLTHVLEQTVRVDTTPPSLHIHTSLPAWSRGILTLTGSAADDGSGLAKVEITTDGGSTWQTVAGTNSWSFDWDTTSGASGPSHARLRSRDMAGLQTERALSAGVDNSPPKVSLPDSWLQWDAVTLDVWDNDSGLSEVRVEISDPEGRWKTRRIDLDPNGFPLNFKWDRYFGDGTVAPLGTYPVKVIAYDNLGNLTQKTSTARILLGILPGGPTATPQPYARIDSTPMPASTQGSFFTPTAVSTPVTNVFGFLPEFTDQTQAKPATRDETTLAIAVTPRAAPTQTTVMDWLESIFIPDSTGETVTDTRTPVTDPSPHWGATLAAMAAAVTAYSLAEKRKREEEERPLSGLQQKIRAQKTQDMKAKEALMREIAQLQAEQKRPKAESEALMREIALFEAEQKRLETEKEALKQKKEIDRLSHIRTSRKEEMLERERKNHPANLLEGQTATAMTGMDIYRASERAKYEPTPPKTWWENTKSFVNENLVQPVNASVYQPLLKPAAMTMGDAAKNGFSWLNENLFQPLVQPIARSVSETVAAGASWLNENIYQPHLKPGIEKGLESIKSGAAWVNENIYRPIIKPELERRIEALKTDVEWINEKIYQPYIKPAVGWVNENIYQPHIKPGLESELENIRSRIAWVNENIYQPVFQPVLSDIEQYIYKPLKEKSSELWDEYGEWVHGSLDAVGFIPGLGEIADGLNGLIYLAEGRYIEAAVSAMAMIPILGDLGKAGKWTLKAGKEILEEAVEKVAKEAAEELLEKVAKETVEEIGEKIIKETSEELATKVARDTLEEVAEEAAEKTLRETSEVLTTKITKESVEATTEKVVKETSEELAEKAIKETSEKTTKEVTENVVTKTANDTTEELTSAGNKVLSKEAKETLVEQVLEKVDDKTAALVRSVVKNIGDKVASINTAISLVQKYGYDAVIVLKAVEPKAAAKVFRTVDKNILDDVVKQGSDAIAAFSGWTEKELKEHAKELAARAAKDAEVLNDVKTLVGKGPIDIRNLTDEQRLLIEKIAANSTFNVDGKKIVVGKWTGLDGGFLGRAKETGSLHYSPHPDLWGLFDKLENQNEVAWLINKQVIQTGVGKGLPFEYTLNGILAKDIGNERAAIKAIFSDQTEETIKRKLKSDYLPVRMRELQELKNAGFDLTFDEMNNSYSLIKP